MNNQAAQLSIATPLPQPGLPRTLAAFRDFHQGATVLVCGCGTSLNELTCPERFITIGVNDVGRLFDPTYLVVLNPRNQFSGDRFRYVEQSRAQAVFTQLDLGIPHPHVVRFPLGSHGGADFSNPEILHYTSNSPYLAVCLAAHLGARRIGLIGVDFTDHHFFATTGKHALTARLNQINREYAALERVCRERGIEIVNLSRQSLLTAFPKGSIENLINQRDSNSIGERESGKDRRVFFVNYRFLSCGEVFTKGLRNAARELGIQAQDAYWDDPQLPAKVRAFGPDLLFVVHGRRFVQRWGGAFRFYNSAVWLVDEPYEVDDTASWSSQFNTVYINDPSTLDRHRNAHYLPVAYDPGTHRDTGIERRYLVGFIGGYNATREHYLLSLAKEDLLSYVVGGPWKAPALCRLCRAANIPASATAELYRQTRLVINVFRDIHHYNGRRVQPYSLNPRIYESLACGALVVSEQRPELAEVLPDLPVFSNAAQLLDTVRALLTDEEHYRAIQRTCVRHLAEHTYRARLLQILETCAATPMVKPVHLSCEVQTMSAPTTALLERAAPLSLDSWTDYGGIARRTAEGGIVLDKLQDDRPGTEQGLVSTAAYRDIELSFELKLAPAAWFIAKVHQQDQFNQCANSYHLVSHSQHSYLARHNHVLCELPLASDQWHKISLWRYGGMVEIEVDGTLVARVQDRTLQQGYCFLGVKGGQALLHHPALRQVVDWSQPACSPRPRLLLVTHAWGGGTERHIEELAVFLEPRFEVLILRPAENDHVSLTWRRNGTAARAIYSWKEQYAALLETLRALQVTRVHYHQVIGYPAGIDRLVMDLGVPFDSTIHDYYPVCPQITLTGPGSAFCGQPEEAVCNRCLAEQPAFGCSDIAVWRERHAWLLQRAERIFVPSQDVAMRLRRYYPDLEVVLAPHTLLRPQVPSPTPHYSSWREDQPFRILVIGQLSIAKGLLVLADCAQDSANCNLPLEFHLLGTPSGPLPMAPKVRLHIHGAYRHEETPKHVAEIRPHLVWFPAQGPETFSYTLSACLEAGLPVIAPNLGAFPERLAGRAWSWVVPLPCSAYHWNSIFMQLAHEHFGPGRPPAPPPGEQPVATFSYTDHYLCTKAFSSTRQGVMPAALAALDKGTTIQTVTDHSQPASIFLQEWCEYGKMDRSVLDGVILLGKPHDDGPGAEQGLISVESYENVELLFEVKLEPDTCFVAKVHQLEQFNQKADSYHLICHPQYTYLAMHNRVLRHIRLKRGTWQQLGLRRYGDRVEIEVAGALVARVHNSRLQRGYCFLGVKGGVAALRNITLRVLPDAKPDMVREDVLAEAPPVPEYTLLYSSEGTDQPTVSIITTVYDRVQCLRECLQSVKQLGYRDFEQIIVSDHPPADVVADILHLLKKEATGAVSYANLQQRFNNWGIAPASVGVHLARGHYLCFLSDDNGYTPDHLNPLVAALEQDQTLGFGYSSCCYAGRLMLRNSTPHPGRIDLGQPLFRKELFERYLPGALPFDMMAWDWHMIDAFMQYGVKWRHIDRPSFLFRLADCKRMGRA